MPLSLAEAAAATGTNRTTILRAIKAGKVSVSRDAHGAWVVEPAELHRVYPPVDVRVPGDRTARSCRAQIAEAAQIAALRETTDLMRAQLEDVRKDRDHWRDQAQAAIRQLADAPASATPEPDPRRWWKRLVGETQ